MRLRKEFPAWQSYYSTIGWYGRCYQSRNWNRYVYWIRPLDYVVRFTRSVYFKVVRLLVGKRQLQLVAAVRDELLRMRSRFVLQHEDHRRERMERERKEGA